MISASSLHRAASCPASTQITPIDITGDAAIFGTANHAAIEDAFRAKQWDALPPEIASAFRDTEVKGIEVALVYNFETDTVRVIGESKSRSYGEVSPSEIPMTIDIVCQDELVTVTDWKSRERVSHAKDNWQIKAQVLGVSRWLGVGEVVGRIWYLDNHESSAHTFSEFDFEDIRIGLGKIVRATREASNPRVGPWCKYCPAAIACPAQTAILQRAMELTKPGAVSTDEELYYGLRELEKFIETSLQAVRTRVSARPLQLSNGKELILTERTKQAFDQGEAKRILTEMGRPIPFRQSSYTQLMERKVKEE